LATTRWLLTTLTCGFFASTGAVFAADDPAAGKQVFDNECSACHSRDPNEQLSGPSLKGIVGRKSASLEDFDYSPAMQAANKTWDPATLNTYLIDPQARVPGTKMLYPGLKDAGQRGALVAYLATLK
jgi:cytochrome c